MIRCCWPSPNGWRRGCARRTCWARFGADEFAVLLQEVTETACTAVAERLLVDAVRRPLTILGHRITVTDSAGAAVASRGEDAQTPLGHGGAARARARQAGGDAHVLFGPTPIDPLPLARSRLGADALQDRLAHLLLLQAAVVAANEADTLQQAADVVMGQICAHAGGSLSRLWVVPAEATSAGPPIWHVAGPGDYLAFQALSESLSVVSGIDLPGRVWAGGRPVWVNDLAADRGWPRRAPRLAAGLASGFAFPVRAGLDVATVVEVFSRARLQPTAAFVDVVASIGIQLGRVVERQRATAALRRSADDLRVAHARLGQACALARLGHWHYDLATGETTWSPEMYRLSGLDPADPAPDLDAALASVHPADRPRARAALSRLVSGGRAAEEVRMVGPDGTLRWARAEGAVIRDETGRVVAVHGTSQDTPSPRWPRRRCVSEAAGSRRPTAWPAWGGGNSTSPPAGSPARTRSTGSGAGSRERPSRSRPSWPPLSREIGDARWPPWLGPARVVTRWPSTTGSPWATAASAGSGPGPSCALTTRP